MCGIEPKYNALALNREFNNSINIYDNTLYQNILLCLLCIFIKCIKKLNSSINFELRYFKIKNTILSCTSASEMKLDSYDFCFTISTNIARNINVKNKSYLTNNHNTLWRHDFILFSVLL